MGSHAFDQLRGQLAGLASGLAWRVGDFILLCRKLPGYEDAASESFPLGLRGLVARAAAVLRHNGVLDEYRPRLTTLLDRIAAQTGWIEIALCAEARITGDEVVLMSYAGGCKGFPLADDVSVARFAVSMQSLQRHVMALADLHDAFAASLSRLAWVHHPMLGQAKAFMAAYRGALEMSVPLPLFGEALADSEDWQAAAANSA
jgi:hypothetical protein